MSDLNHIMDYIFNKYDEVFKRLRENELSEAAQAAKIYPMGSKVLAVGKKGIIVSHHEAPYCYGVDVGNEIIYCALEEISKIGD